MSKKINTPADFEKPTDEELRRGSVHLNGFVDIESPQDFAKAFESKKLTVEDVNQLFEGVPLRNKPAPKAGNDLGQVLGAHDVERGTEINPRYVGRGTKQMHIPEYSLEDLANVEIYREKLKADRKAVEEIKNEADSESNPFAKALDKLREETHQQMTGMELKSLLSSAMQTMEVMPQSITRQKPTLLGEMGEELDTKPDDE